MADEVDGSGARELAVAGRAALRVAASDGQHRSWRGLAPATDRLFNTAAPALVRLAYLWRHGRLPDLKAPERFTELVQHRKLFNRDPRLPTMIDKVAVKRFVGEMLGTAWVTPTLWAGEELPHERCWEAPFVVKSRHGCNQRCFVRTGNEDWNAVRSASDRWMRLTYGRWLAEWGYRSVPKGLLVEPFVGRAGQLPLDYKVFVFHGRAEFVQLHLEREHDHRWVVFDRAWRPVSRPTSDTKAPAPRSLEAMLQAAEVLGRGFDFVRIDFYEVDGKPRFGEMTFYPGSGLDPFDPVELDVALGQRWRDRSTAIAIERGGEDRVIAAACWKGSSDESIASRVA